MKKRRKKSIFRKLLMIVLILVIIAGSWWIYRTKKQVDQVKKWENEVSVATEKYGIEEYKEIVLSIILTETKGQHVDLMQSSESRYGSQTSITTSEESIDAGVSFFADAIASANEQGCDIWTAVQAYNFGLSYIDFVANNGGKNSSKLAETYSKDYVAPSLGNKTGDKYTYYSLPAIFNGKLYLYTNGGNFFYADLVRFNINYIKYL